MLDFDKFVARHSESAAQAIVEQLERQEGIRYGASVTLEQRWNAVMQSEQDRYEAA